jgi:hypothetical protein
VGGNSSLVLFSNSFDPLPCGGNLRHFARKRMVKEDLEKKSKNPADPFRLVFVCVM